MDKLTNEILQLEDEITELANKLNVVKELIKDSKKKKK